MAYQFAKKKDTPYVQDPVFRANFMKYFTKELPPPATKKTKFEDIDFSQFYRLVDQEKMQKGDDDARRGRRPSPPAGRRRGKPSGRSTERPSSTGRR